ncbi:hypothetical protein DMH27_05310 [Raoultella planticola]|nr:hypothetical protein [Raoultella planticola]
MLTLYGLYLNSKKKMRLQFDAQFSEALNIINSSIRAGNSVIQGLSSAGKRLTVCSAMNSDKYRSARKLARMRKAYFGLVATPAV